MSTRSLDDTLDFILIKEKRMKKKHVSHKKWIWSLCQHIIKVSMARESTVEQLHSIVCD
jgi:hypothetical protein